MLTTSWLSTVFFFGSSGVPHPVERLGHPSGWHALNFSLRNTVPWHHAFPSQSHPVDPQAHLKTVTLPENTSHRVNGIPELLRLEVWIQFSHSSQFASSHYFLSCTNGTHQIFQNSINSKMYFSHWETPGVCGRRQSVKSEASISGENQTLGGHCGGPSEWPGSPMTSTGAPWERLW